ncbi:MAG: D-alanyl-D-alanine carboxypeptidase [Alphaproteobacteria bacterium]|nr:D-alanyl-D-alanine carboxypeptidase [Alphaproteobacteria bacterium]
MPYLRIIICLIFFNYLNDAVGLSPRYTAIVIDAHTGQVLEQDGADKICHPASLTKMMTLYMVFEALKSGKLQMNSRVYVSAHASRQAPSKLGLRAGEYVSVETIIKGLVTKSANDGAAAIGEHLGGSEANFAMAMTQKAKKLGMHKTIFKNASGLPNPHQVTTARDMATLSRALYLHFPKDYGHFRLKAFNHRGQVHRNHNHLLNNRRGLDVDGIKTGYVAASGFNISVSAIRKRANHKPIRLIAVVLGGPNRHWRDRRVADLLEMNFEKVGLGESVAAPHYSSKDDDDDFDNEVNEFLKSEPTPKVVSKPELRPIAISWPPPAPKVKVNHMPRKNVWGVQIGTYKSLNEAKMRAKRSLAILKSGEVSTPKVTKGKKSFYGARLLGISKQEAESVCKKHGSKGECRLLASW